MLCFKTYSFILFFFNEFIFILQENLGIAEINFGHRKVGVAYLNELINIQQLNACFYFDWILPIVGGLHTIRISLFKCQRSYWLKLFYFQRKSHVPIRIN